MQNTASLLFALIVVGIVGFVVLQPHEPVYAPEPTPTIETTIEEIATSTPLTEHEQTAKEAAVVDVPLQQEPQKVEESITAAEDTEPTSPVTTPATTHTTTIAVVETQSFYTTPKMSLDDVNSITMPAIVNILCAGRQGGTVGGATGTGIIIDSRGIILTNAHVAQYLLVSKHESEPTRCTIRTGAPARNKYIADVIAFPLVWAQEHAATIADEQQSGTGEHDWALLYITGTTDGSPLPATFPSVQFDTRQAVTTTGDAVLIASYPAGFLGGATLQKDLWPAATTVAIQKVFTFVRTTIDVLSLGGSIVAQAGASGGAVMNEWGQLVGLVSTSSLGDTTDERDLRAITVSHIDTSVTEQTGSSLLSWLQQGDFQNRLETFNQNSVPYLLTEFPL